MIDFWLNFCVFPTDMQQYPQRITTNSWHIAHNHPSSTCVGFSGTNDNHRILPLQVKQYFPDDIIQNKEDELLRVLFATNGKMLNVIINNTKKCIGCENIDLEKLIDVAINEECSAVIDCGAALAGKRNFDVACKICERMNSHLFKGVAFYNDGWKIREINGMIKPKHQSPIKDEHLFVIFDEPHCRGSDFKLPSTATAALTIGPGMTKDKLMQGAGRMRQLERGQKLVFLCGDDVGEKLRSIHMSKSHSVESDDWTSSGWNANDALLWVMSNTINLNKNSLVTWCAQGMFYLASEVRVENSIENERLTLEDLYDNIATTISFEKAATILQENAIGDSTLCERNKVFSRDIVERLTILGKDYLHLSHSACDEECERELELQEEEEEEKEVSIILNVALRNYLSSNHR